MVTGTLWLPGVGCGGGREAPVAWTGGGDSVMEAVGSGTDRGHGEVPKMEQMGGREESSRTPRFLGGVAGWRVTSLPERGHWEGEGWLSARRGAPPQSRARPAPVVTRLLAPPPTEPQPRARSGNSSETTRCGQPRYLSFFSKLWCRGGHHRKFALPVSEDTVCALSVLSQNLNVSLCFFQGLLCNCR